jgi:DNA-binding Xre family transcriptional regulator
MSLVFSGALLRAQVTSRGARLEDLAVITGMSWVHLNRLCHDKIRPSTRTIEVLADALGCEPGDLFADDGKSRALPPPDGQEPPPLTPETRAKLRALLTMGGEGGAA